MKGKSEEKLIYELVDRRAEGENNPAAELCEEFTRGLMHIWVKVGMKPAAIFRICPSNSLGYSDELLPFPLRALSG